MPEEFPKFLGEDEEALGRNPLQTLCRFFQTHCPQFVRSAFRQIERPVSSLTVPQYYYSGGCCCPHLWLFRPCLSAVFLCIASHGMRFAPFEVRLAVSLEFDHQEAARIRAFEDRHFLICLPSAAATGGGKAFPIWR